MDFLRRIGRFIGGAAQGVGRAFQQAPQVVSRAVQDAERARQQAVAQVQRNLPRFQAPPPPRIQLPQIQIPRVQLPQVRLPQAPRVDLGAVSRALQGVGQGIDITKRTAFGQQLTPQQQRLVGVSPQLKSQVQLLQKLPKPEQIAQVAIPAYGVYKNKSQIDRTLKSISPTYQKLTQEAPNTAKGFAMNIEQAVKKATGQQISQAEFNKMNEYYAKGFFPSLQVGKKVSAKDVTKDVLRTGVPVGVEVGSFATGTQLKGLSLAGKAAQIAKAAAVGGTALTGQDVLTGQGKLEQRLQRAPQTFLTGAGLTAGGEVIGYGTSKVLGKLGKVLFGELKGPEKTVANIAIQKALSQAQKNAPGIPVTKAAQAGPTPRPIAENIPVSKLGAQAEKIPQVTPVPPAQIKAINQDMIQARDIDRLNVGNVQGLSQSAKNSLENKAVGIKSGALERARNEILSGNLPPVKVEVTDLKGGANIIDGRHHLEAARQLGITNYPIDVIPNKFSKQLGVPTGEFLPTAQAKVAKPIYETIPKSAMEPKGPKGKITPEIKLSSAGNVYIKVGKNEIIRIPKTIQKDIYNASTGIIPTAERRLKANTILNKNGLEMTVDGKIINFVEKTQLPATPSKIAQPTPRAMQSVAPVPESAMRPKGVEPPKSSVQTVIDALAEAKPIRGKQERLYSAERARRAARVAAMGEKVQGEKGFFAQLGQLKGELPKAQFEGIRKQITQPVVDDLFNQIEKSNISVFEKVTAKQGLAKLLGAEGGVVPTRGELSLLNEVFPKELTQAILAKRTVMQKLGSVGGEIINLPRSIQASVDLSGPLRQGALLIGRPKQWIPAFASMFKYAGSEKAYQGLMENIRMRPTYQAMRQSKLALTDMKNPLQGREEAFMSNLAEKIPAIGRVIKGSDRAYTGFINKLRADTFDDLLNKAKQTGAFDNNPQIADDIAKFVNTATGRGNLPGSVERAAVVLNGVFFSPRLMASRIQTLNPVYYVKLDPFVRKEALKSLLTFAGIASSIVGMSKLGGAEVGIDPRSADFGKIKIGDTRYDPYAGFQQYIVLGSRLLTGQMISSTTGKEIRLGEGYKTPNRLDIITRFLQSKESPIASFVTGLLQQQTATGEKFNIPAEVVDRFIPMMANDLYDLYREYGTKGLAMGIPGLFGAGSQTYTDQIPMKGKTASGKENITWRQAPSLGETIVNKVTGTQISNIPKEQWASLQEKKKVETQWGIDLAGIKAKVLSTGESQTAKNPVTGKDIQVYLKDGVVTTKEIKTKQAKTPKIKALKARRARVGRGRRTGGRGRIAKVKAPKVSIPKVSVKGLPKVPTVKAKKLSFKVPTPKATARKSIKIKTG